MQGDDVLILAGSLGRHSVTRIAGEILARNLSESGLSTRLLPISDLNLPLFNPDVHYADRAVAQDFLNAVRRSRAMIWCAPSYHRTISGSFKNAIDFMELLLDDKPSYLTGKVVGCVSASKGIVAASNTTSELAMAAQALRAFTFPLLVPITAAHHALDEAGNLKDKRIEGKLDLLADEMRLYLASHPAIKADEAAE